MTGNRETSRDQLATLLEDELMTNLGIVQAVYNRKVGDLQGQSPVVAVLSAGTGRPPTTFGVNSAEFHYEIQIWVIYAATDWTEANAEDRLDLIEKEIAEVIEDNDVLAGVWDNIEYAGRSTVADVTTSGGVPYVLERIPIMVEVY